MCFRPSDAEIAAAEAAGPKTKDCPSCGASNPLTAKTCEQCGAKFPPMRVAHAAGPAGPGAPTPPAPPSAPKPPAAPGGPKPTA